MSHLANLKIEINTFGDFLGNPCPDDYTEEKKKTARNTLTFADLKSSVLFSLKGAFPQPLPHVL